MLRRRYLVAMAAGTAVIAGLAAWSVARIVSRTPAEESLAK
jgi:hypothetical protein